MDYEEILGPTTKREMNPAQISFYLEKENC